MNTRERMQTIQNELLNALMQGSAPPHGFDQADVELCGRTLQTKRLRTIKRMHPWLSAILSESLLDTTFAGYTKQAPFVSPEGASADATDFVKYLETSGYLPERAFSRWRLLLSRLKLFRP